MKTSDLTGALLDYWVAKIDPRCEGCGIAYIAEHMNGPHWVGSTEDGAAFFIPTKNIAQVLQLKRTYRDAEAYRPHMDWSQGGPIIEREIKALREGGGEGIWKSPEAYKCQFVKDGYVGEGETPLIAAMRAYVASVYGDEVLDET